MSGFRASIVPDADGHVTIAGVRYARHSQPRYVVRNKKSRRYGVHLGVGMNAYFYVQPMRANGELSKQKGHWTHETHWQYAGEVDYCAAVPIVPSPSTWWAKLRVFLFGGPRPKYEWTEHFTVWSETRPVFGTMPPERPKPALKA